MRALEGYCPYHPPPLKYVPALHTSSTRFWPSSFISSYNSYEVQFVFSDLAPPKISMDFY